MSTFGFHSTAEEVTAGRDLTGTTFLVTGVASGLGRETARVLALRGATIIGLARSAADASRTFDELGIVGTPVSCDLSNLASVRAAVDAVGQRPLDGIIANAGIMALQTAEQIHNIEKQFFVNHLGHFALVTGILSNLTENGRVVIVSSEAHRMANERGLELDNIDGKNDYQPWRLYGRSKLANILFARSLARQFAGTSRTANALHPGVIQTNLARHIPNPGPMFARMKNIEKTIPQGAATQVYLATHPDVADVSGKYFSDCAELAPIAHATDDALADALWAWSTETLAALD